jgi:hypothetical protein
LEAVIPLKELMQSKQWHKEVDDERKQTLKISTCFETLSKLSRVLKLFLKVKKLSI